VPQFGVNLYLDFDFTMISEMLEEVDNLVSQLVAFQQNIDGYVAVEKYLLVKQGIFDSVRQRGPVRTILSSQVKSDIDQIFDKLVKVVNN
jgi:4-hydroxy-tetrahydrodipicolinate synthase